MEGKIQRVDELCQSAAIDGNEQWRTPPFPSDMTTEAAWRSRDPPQTLIGRGGDSRGWDPPNLLSSPMAKQGASTHAVCVCPKG